MITAWMLYSMAIGCLVAAASLAGERFCRSFRLPVRWTWAVGLLATAVLTGTALLTTSPQPVSLPLVELSTVEATGAPAESGIDVIAAAAMRARAAVSTALDGAYGAVMAGTTLSRSLVIMWSMSSVALLLLFAATLFRLRGARAGWRSHRISGTGVLVTPGTGPALVGLLRASIVIPEWLLAEPVEHQELVVRHEEEHRRAGDHVLLAACCLIVCLLPWNPAVWWLLLRTRLAVELDCDARVLRRGVQPRSYGSLLLDIAGRSRVRPFGATGLADSTTHLERRLIAMTENHRTPQYRSAGAAGVAALLLTVAACAADLPTSAAIDDMNVADAQAQAERAGLLSEVSTDSLQPLMFVDRVLMAPSRAREIPAEAIARIEVVKAELARRTHGEAGANGIIFISTHPLRADGTGATAVVASSAAAASSGADAAAVYAASRADTAGSVRIRAATMKDGSDAASARAAESRLALTEVNRAATLRASSLSNTEIGTGPDSPLVVIDGVIAPASFRLSNLDADTIERVEIVKGPAARDMFDDPRAANGVIRITTKAAVR